MSNMPNTNDPRWPILSANWRRGALRLLIAPVLAMVLALNVQPTSAWAQEEATPEAPSDEEAAPEVKRLLSLGTIRLKELRPEKNETIKLSFEVHFLLNPEITDEDFEILETWQHRLRDQVIIAVRTAESNDFREPGLMRLRRIIRFRIEQVLEATIVDSLLLSDYSFSME